LGGVAALPVTARAQQPSISIPAIGLLHPGLTWLARSTRDLLNVLDQIGKRGAGFKSLKDTWADTTTAHGRLMLTVLGGLAEFDKTHGRNPAEPLRSCCVFPSVGHSTN
jgi:Resolvase, N terminal domain